MIEEWKNIAEYPGYQISSFGRCKSIDRNGYRFYKGKILKQGVDKDGYLRCYFSINGKHYYKRTHQLVAQYFIFNPCPLTFDQVNHIDGNKQNSHYKNLEWTNNSGNQKHAIDSGLKTFKCGKQHCNFIAPIQAYKNGIFQFEICGNKDATEKGFDMRLVSACLFGKRKTHRGHTFTRQ